MKKGPRAKRAQKRRELSVLSDSSPSPSPISSRSVTPLPTVCTGQGQEQATFQNECSISSEPCCSSMLVNESLLSQSQTQVTVNTALLARIEFLESENASLKKDKIEIQSSQNFFNIEQIHNNDELVRFYTGFFTYSLFLSFFQFLGPAVDNLNYWGSKEGTRVRQRTRKISPINQLFLTLIKLRLNLKVKDLSVRFGLSCTQISRYLTTWICFLYKHLSELDWMPTVEQVSGTLPSAFRFKYPNTYAIIDGSEIFIETPSDLPCNPLPGVNTNITIPLNFWLRVPQMELFAMYLLSMLAPFQM